MDPGGEKPAEPEDLKRKSCQLDPEPPSAAKQTKLETAAESSSDDDPFVPNIINSSDDEAEVLSNSSSDSETQGFDLDGYLKYCKETQDPVQ